MLVLSRKLNEKITIGDHEITVTILEIKGGRVRIGVDAPPYVRVNRQELNSVVDARFSAHQNSAPHAAAPTR